MINSFEQGESKELAYDLRQIYANLIVGSHLVHAAECRKSLDFYGWFKALEDIKTVTIHKFKGKDCEEEFEHLRSNIKDLAQKYTSTWNGETSDNVGLEKIDNALRKLEEWIYKNMESAKMFGELGHTPGLS